MKSFILAMIVLFTPFIPHTDADVQILGDVMWLENGYTGKNEQENREVLTATGAVVANRIKSGRWGGTTVKDVIYAKDQYAKSTRDRIGKTNTPEWVYELADDILTYGTNLPEYVIYQSMQPNLGTVWKTIDGEFFATNGGHKNEGKDITIKVNQEPSHRTISLPAHIAYKYYDELHLHDYGYEKTYIDVDGHMIRAFTSKYCDIIIPDSISDIYLPWRPMRYMPDTLIKTNAILTNMIYR